MPQYLRQGRGRRRKRREQNTKQGKIPGRVGVEHRSVIADPKTEVGHWESDTITGANHSRVIVTYVDTSKFLVAGLDENKTAEEINQREFGLRQLRSCQLAETSQIR